MQVLGVPAWNECQCRSDLMAATEELNLQTDLCGTHEGSLLLSQKDGEAQGGVQIDVVPPYWSLSNVLCSTVH